MSWPLLRVLQLGAAPIPSDVPVPSVDDLADQVADVLDFFRYCVVTLVLVHGFFHCIILCIEIIHWIITGV